MQTRKLGRTGYNVTEVGFGTWNIGAGWGPVSEEDGIAAVKSALDAGITFIDTADVYGDGKSETYIAKVLADVSPHDRPVVATKAGRFLNPHVAEAYNRENLTKFVEDSLRRLEVEALDLVQLHCPPTPTYYQPETFEALEEMKAAGKIQHYGVSVEKVEEAIKAIEYPGVETVQIIFNVFRHRPADLFFEQAKKRDVGVIVRVPLASGLLSGKMSADTTFTEDDHRNFNRHGDAFDVGETFSGVPFERGLEAVEVLRSIVPEGMTMAQFALRWILMFDAVSVVIPGSTKPEHIRANVEAAAFAAFTGEQMAAIRKVYDDYIYESVHHRW